MSLTLNHMTTDHLRQGSRQTPFLPVFKSRGEFYGAALSHPSGSSLRGLRCVQSHPGIGPRRAARWILTLLLGMSAAGETISADEFSRLTVDVSQIVSPGAVGPVEDMIPAEKAWRVIVTGDADTSKPSHFCLARQFGNGRVLALGHDGIMFSTWYDNETFLRNVAEWLKGGRQKRIAFTSGHKEFVRADNSTAFKSAAAKGGFTVNTLGATITAQALQAVDVLVVGNAWGPFQANEVTAVKDFVTAGGGVLLVGLGWSWVASNPNATLDSFPMAVLAAPYGVRWRSEVIRDLTDHQDGSPIFHVFPAANSPPRLPAALNLGAEAGVLFSWPVAATDPDIPANRLTFALEGTVPSGAAIDAATGLFTWTPRVDQAPNTYAITIKVTDDGIPPLSTLGTLNIAVTLKNPPSILIQPVDQVVTVGGRVTFQVTADGDQPLSFAWTKDGRDIPGANSDTWILDPVTLADQGSYGVLVSNRAGSVRGREARLTVAVPPAESKVELTPAGRWPERGDGRCLAVRVSGRHAYVAHREMLTIFDVTNPAQPDWVASLPLPPIDPGALEEGRLPQMQVVGSLLYMARVNAGLQIVNVADPLRPQLAGFYPARSARDVQVVGSRAYLADDLDGLLIFDVRDPANITPLGAALYPISRVRVAGVVAYAVHNHDFYAFNITNPAQVTRLNPPRAQPTLEGRWAGDLEVAGRLGYVVASSQLVILNLDDPTQEKVIHVFESGDSSLDLVGTTAFLGVQVGGFGLSAEFGESRSGLRIVDLRNPSSPQMLSELTSTLGVTFDLQAHQGHVYLANSRGLKVIRTDSLATPRQVAFRSTAPGPASLGVLNDRLLVAAGELLNLDLANPNQLTRLPGYSFVLEGGQTADLRHHVISGQLVYAMSSDPSHFLALDLKTPGQANVLSSLPLGPASGSFDIQLQGKTAYVSYWRSDAPAFRLDIIDVSNPAVLRRLGGMEGPAPRLYPYGEHALGWEEGSWGLYNLSVPGQVQFIRKLDLQVGPGYRALQISGNKAYLAGELGLFIIDLSTPLDPRLAGQIQFSDFMISGLALSVSPQATNVYLTGAQFGPSGGRGRLQVINASDPRSLFRVAEYEFPSPAIRCLRSGAELLVATEEAVYRFQVMEGSLPVITAQPSSQTVPAGSQVIFSVTAAGANPLAYHWRKDGSPLPGATDSTLVLQSVSLNQAGSYQVTVRNPAGEILSAVAQLTVTAPPAPPVLLIQPQDQEAPLGGSVTFRTEAESATPVTYQWQRNNTLLPNAGGPVLILTNLSLADAGEYTVVVRNDAGSVTSRSARLYVNDGSGPPVIREGPRSLQAGAGGTAILTVRAEGVPPLTYQWFKNGVPIPGANQNSLSWASVQSSDAGSYRVSIRNPGGQVISDTVEFTVLDPALLEATRLELTRKPDSLQLHIPNGRGTYAIYEGTTVDGFTGSPWTQGEFEGPANLSWPASLTSGQRFFQARIDVQPPRAGFQETDEPDFEEPAPDYVFHWETPSDTYAAGSSLEMKGTIASRSGQPLVIGGWLEMGFDDAMTGKPMPEFVTQPARLPISQGVVQGMVQVSGAIAPDAQPRLICRIRPALGFILPRTLQNSAAQPVEISTPVRQSGRDDYRVTGDGPWASPLKGQPIITGAFGEWPRGSAGQTRIHKGLDLRAPFGTEIFAAEKGIVIATSAHNQGGGVTIYHGNGFATRYYHVAALPHIRRGSLVKRGDPIGKTGLLGGITDEKQCHLHFEIHQVTEENVAPALKEKGTQVHQPGEEVNPLGGRFKYGFIPALNGHPENRTDPQLDRVRLTPANPATTVYALNHSAQDPLADSAPLRYLLFQVSHWSARKTMVDELSVKPDGQPVTTISLRNTSDAELSSRVENPESPGFATVPPSYKNNWSEFVPQYYRLWTSWDTSPYQGLNDGPKLIKVSLRSVADTSKSYELRYGAALGSYKNLEANPNNGKLRFEGEVALHNGAQSIPASQQRSKIILESSPEAQFVEVSQKDWPEASDHELTSKELAAYGSKLTFRFEVPSWALSSCGAPEASQAWVKAYLPGLPMIVHQLPIENPHPDFAFRPAYREVEAGQPVVLDLVLPSNGSLPLSIATWQWSYRELKAGQRTTPAGMPMTARESARFWHAIPFLVREKHGQFQLMGKSQGLFELTVRDGQGRTACARIRVKKTLIEVLAQTSQVDLEYPVHFLPDTTPVPTDGATVTISGRVVDQESKPVSLCGSLHISIVDPKFFTSWEVAPSRLPIVDGQVSGQVHCSYKTPFISPPPRAEFEFEVYPPPLGTPPDSPRLTLTPAQQETRIYTGWNQLERDILAWQGLSPSDILPPEVPGIGAFAIDLPPGEEVELHLQSEGCIPFQHRVGWTRYEGLEYRMGGQVLPAGYIPVIQNSDGVRISIRNKVTP